MRLKRKRSAQPVDIGRRRTLQSLAVASGVGVAASGVGLAGVQHLAGASDKRSSSAATIAPSTTIWRSGKVSAIGASEIEVLHEDQSISRVDPSSSAVVVQSGRPGNVLTTGDHVVVEYDEAGLPIGIAILIYEIQGPIDGRRNDAIHVNGDWITIPSEYVTNDKKQGIYGPAPRDLLTNGRQVALQAYYEPAAGGLLAHAIFDTTP